MISAARLAANRANAQKSTGPRTRAGKLRSAQNARRHGLFGRPEPDSEQRIAELARAITKSQPRLRALATQVAEAQYTLDRVRKTRLDLLARAEAGDTRPDHLRRLEAIDGYESRARTRRTLAVSKFDFAARLICHPLPLVQTRKHEDADAKDTVLRNEPTAQKPQI
jgi:hypothetical protein